MIYYRINWTVGFKVIELSTRECGKFIWRTRNKTDYTPHLGL
jgi:hypothetical protein